MLVIALFIRLCSFCHVLHFRVICGLSMVVIGDFCYKTNQSSLIPTELPNLKSALTHKQFGRLTNDGPLLNPDRILVSTSKGASIFAALAVELKPLALTLQFVTDSTIVYCSGEDYHYHSALSRAGFFRVVTMCSNFCKSKLHV